MIYAQVASALLSIYISALALHRRTASWWRRCLYATALMFFAALFHESVCVASKTAVTETERILMELDQIDVEQRF